MKNLLFFLIFFCVKNTFAQNKSFLTGATVGLITINSGSSGISKTGFTTSTGLDYRLSDKLWLAGILEFQMISYEKNTSKFDIQGKIYITPFKAGLRYMLADKILSPYLTTNLGLAIIDSPTAELNGSIIKIDSQSELSFGYDLGVGVQWKFKPTFFPFLEANFNQFLGKNEISNRSFEQISIKFGIRTYPF
jgi:opacity protein-like surface antigen